MNDSDVVVLKDDPATLKTEPWRYLSINVKVFHSKVARETYTTNQGIAAEWYGEMGWNGGRGNPVHWSKTTFNSKPF
jgi:hypothetical protein